MATTVRSRFEVGVSWPDGLGEVQGYFRTKYEAMKAAGVRAVSLDEAGLKAQAYVFDRMAGAGHVELWTLKVIYGPNGREVIHHIEKRREECEDCQEWFWWVSMWQPVELDPQVKDRLERYCTR